MLRKMKIKQRISLPKKALLYFKIEKILCITPLKYIISGEQVEGSWVKVLIPQEKEKGEQCAQIMW